MDEMVKRLAAALEPFVRSLDWVEDGDMPVRVGNDTHASAWDLLPEEVAEARAAYAAYLELEDQ